MARKKTSISGQKTRIYSRFLHTVKTSLLRSAPSLDDFAPNVRPQTEIKLHFRAPSPSCKVSLLKVPTINSGESQFRTSSIFAAAVFNHVFFSPKTSLFHLDVYLALHRKTMTHILPIRQVRSNRMISFMFHGNYYGIDRYFQARKLRLLSWQRFLQALYF